MIFKESEKAELKKSTAELKDALKDILQKSISVLRNPGIAEVLFLAGYIERWGSGVKKMNGLMKEYGLSKPVYEGISGNFLVTFKRKKILIRKKLETKTVPSLSQVCPKSVPDKLIVKILNKLSFSTSITKLMEVAGQANRTRFRNRILKPLIKAKFVRMTIPNNPQSPKQKYIITDKGKKMIENSREGRS